MRLLPVCLLSLYLIACKPPVEPLPPSPVSVDAVKKALVGKSYHTTDVGLLSVFKNDSSINWMSDSKDTSSFFSNYRKERMAYTLQFINDTAFKGVDEGKIVKGSYLVDNEMRESQFHDEDSETPGIKLRLTISNSDNTDTGFADMRNVTYTMTVKGMSDHALLLALPREMNSHKVVGLMKRD